MPSRQDQLHSYQFMVQRVVAALVMRETDPAQSPFRRAAGATLASVLIAAIAVGATVVYGAIVGGGGTSWRDTQAVIVEKESGARYVYFDDKLHLVLNYASALLIIKSQQPKTVLVSRKSIEGVPRGTPLGIADAPDSLPAAGQLTNAPWTVCSTPQQDGSKTVARSVLLVGADAAGGTVLGDDGVLAQHPDGSLYLIWHNYRHLIRDRDRVVVGLWGTVHPVAVAPALLNALPVGADLAPLTIADAGEDSDEVPDAKIGEVFVVERQGGGKQYAVAKREGLAGITEVQANLLLTASDDQEAPTTMSQGKFADIPQLPDLLPSDAAAPPATTPKLAAGNSGAVCGQIRDDGGMREVRAGANVPQVADVPRTSARSAEGGTLADYVVVEAGRGAVVEAAAAPGATGGAISVVTDLGRRHAITSTEVLAWLGYGKVKPVRMPANLVTLIPAGRALDPTAARVPAAQD